MSAVRVMVQNSGNLSERLSLLHTRLMETVPEVDRIACALYDPAEDTLRTFINSTRSGHAITGYEYPLSKSRSLSELARSGDYRVLDDIDAALQADNVHTSWLKSQGYRSSFTVPIYDRNQLLGFVFFDSLQPAVFNLKVQRDLVLYTTVITMMITGEFSAARSMVESARVARELTGIRDFETGAHLERIGRYSRLIAAAVAPLRGCSDEFTEHVALFAPLHDIGKIGIPDKILLKPGPLDPEERAIMQTHVVKGMEVIERILGREGLGQFPDAAVLRNIVLGHHECLDGSGYPQGLRGDQIPLEARIVAVADVFDALTSVRPYKKEWPFDKAFEELERLVASGKLDAECVAALKSHADEARAIHQRYNDPPEGVSLDWQGSTPLPANAQA